MHPQVKQGKVAAMSYPKKLSADTVLDSALTHVEVHGLASLSMRALAAELGVAPNALYRYFASKAELELAMADAAGKRLLAELEAAAHQSDPALVIEAVALAYFRFARHNPELYALKMRYCKQANEPDSHDAVWQFVMHMASALPTAWPPQDLALSLWAFLHGMVELDRANLLDGRPPEGTIQVGLRVMLAGLLSSPPASA
jgi:AcrR family transcriptional regulator